MSFELCPSFPLHSCTKCRGLTTTFGFYTCDPWSLISRSDGGALPGVMSRRSRHQAHLCPRVFCRHRIRTSGAEELQVKHHNLFNVGFSALRRIYSDRKEGVKRVFGFDVSSVDMSNLKEILRSTKICRNIPVLIKIRWTETARWLRLFAFLR